MMIISMVIGCSQKASVNAQIEHIASQNSHMNKCDSGDVRTKAGVSSMLYFTIF